MKDAEPIHDPAFWARRLKTARLKGQLHEAVYLCTLRRWREIEAAHRAILAKHIRPRDDVLDAGCGYGRLLDLMPPEWDGDYCGVDLCPELVALARQRLVENMHDVLKRRSVVTLEFHVWDLLRLTDLAAQVRGYETEGRGWVGADGQGQYARQHPEPDYSDIPGIDPNYPNMESPPKSPDDPDPTAPHEPTFLPGKRLRRWDWGVLISIRPMVVRNMGAPVWRRMEGQLKECCERLLYLEYDPACGGYVE